MLSSRGPSCHHLCLVTPSSNSHTITSLTHLPIAEIIKLPNSCSVTVLPLPKADPLVVKAINKCVDHSLTSLYKCRSSNFVTNCVYPFPLHCLCTHWSHRFNSDSELSSHMVSRAQYITLFILWAIFGWTADHCYYSPSSPLRCWIRTISGCSHTPWTSTLMCCNMLHSPSSLTTQCTQYPPPTCLIALSSMHTHTHCGHHLPLPVHRSLGCLIT